MRCKRLIDDEEGVSPVIGVILMVAITVILSAVIATFVLGLGEQVSSTAPQASFSFEYDNSSSATDDFQNSGGDGILNITFVSGQTLEAGNLAIQGSSVSGGNWADDGPYQSNSEISAGDTISVRVETTDTIQITWTSDTGSSSAILREWQGPDS